MRIAPRVKLAAVHRVPKEPIVERHKRAHHHKLEQSEQEAYRCPALARFSVSLKGLTSSINVAAYNSSHVPAGDGQRVWFPEMGDGKVPDGRTVCLSRP